MDSGAQGNYISPIIAKRLRLVIKEKRNFYTFVIVDSIAIRQRDGRIITKITLIRMKIGNYKERISLDVMEIGTY